MSQWIGARVEDELHERAKKAAKSAPFFGNLSSLLKTALIEWLNRHAEELQA